AAPNKLRRRKKVVAVPAGLDRLVYGHWTRDRGALRPGSQGAMAKPVQVRRCPAAVTGADVSGSQIDRPCHARRNLAARGREQPPETGPIPQLFPFPTFRCDTQRRRRGRTVRMDRLHEMLPEDEILLCGLTLLVGAVLGAAARFLAALRERRSA